MGHYSEKFLDLCFLFGIVCLGLFGLYVLFGLFFGRLYIFDFFWVVFVI